MTEAWFTKLVIRELKTHLPGAIIFKHNDRMTAGIPDLSVTYRGRTTWFELKVINDWGEPTTALRKHFDALQLATMRLLDRQGRAFYLVLVNTGQRLGIHEPTEIARFLTEPTATAPVTAGRPPTVSFSAGLLRLRALLMLIKEEGEDGDQGRA